MSARRVLLLVGGMLICAGVARPAAATDLKLGPIIPIESVFIFSPFSYSIDVDNSSTFGGGPYDSPNTELTTTLPDGLEFVTVTTTQGSCEIDGQTATCDLETIEQFQMATVVFTIMAIKAAKYNLLFSAEGDLFDPNTSNNNAGTSVTAEQLPGADLSVTKTAEDSVRVGDQLVYDLSVTNNGPEDATGVALTDVLQAGLAFADASDGCTESGLTVTCSLATLAAGETHDFQVTVDVLPGALQSADVETGILENTVDVVAGSPEDANTENNSASAGTRVFSGGTITSSNLLTAGASKDPVNTFTGELFFSTGSDLYLGGPMPLSFGRYYASMMARGERVKSALGPNWSHTFDWRIIHWGDAALEVVTSRGRTIPFTTAGSEWEQSGRFDTPLSLVEDGDAFVLVDPRTHFEYHFDGHGRLAGIDNGHGVTQSLTYTGDLLTEVSDGLGRSLSFSYAGSQLAEVSDGSRSISFTYAGDVLSSATDPTGAITSYTYDEANEFPALLEAVILPKGNSIYTQTYDAFGRVATQTDGAGNSYDFSYADGQTIITDPTGQTLTYVHDAAGRLQSLTDEMGRAATFGYDADGHRNQITPREGNAQTYAYDPETGVTTSITRPDGTIATYSYSERQGESAEVADLSSVSYPDGLSQTYTRNASGNIVSMVDRAGQTWTYTYNARGQVTSIDDPLGAGTTISYASDGTLAAIEEASGASTQYSHDAFGRLEEVIHPDGTSRTFEYDAADRITSVTDERGATTVFAYDANGNITTLTDGEGNSTQFEYDAMDRLVEVTDPLGNTDTRSYDQLGRLAGTVDRSGNALQLSYDAAGNLSGLTDPSNATWSYSHSAEGFLTGVSAPTGGSLSYTTDAMGRAASRSDGSALTFDGAGQLASATDALGRKTTIALDGRGRTTALALPGGLQTTYSRDPLSRLSSLTDPSGSSWQYTRDAFGRVVATTDPLGRTTTYTYDERGRLASMEYPDGLGSATLTHDGRGSIESLAFGDGTTFDFERDAMGNLLSTDGIELEFDANNRISSSNGIAIERDPEERITSTTIAPGKVITYTYDARDLITSIIDWLDGTTTFAYDAAGRLESVTRPNGITTSYAYDDNDDLVSIETRADGPAALASISLERDAGGQVISRTADVPLTAAPQREENDIQFDEANQVEGFTYDGLGRRVADASRIYAWDQASRLIEYEENGGGIAFTYDAAGQMLSRTDGGVGRDYVWNYALGLPSIAVSREGGEDSRYFVHTPGGRLLYSVDASSGERRFYHFDEAGSTLFLTDDDGEVAASYAYTPYGRIIASEGEADQPFTYHGEMGVMQEGSSGLYYMRARYYDAIARQFISPDPMQSRFPKATNPYQFAYGNPMEFSDPLGLDVLMPTGTMPRQNPFGGDEGVVLDCGGQSDVAIRSAASTIVSKAPVETPDEIFAGGPTTCPAEPFTISAGWETGAGLFFEGLEAIPEKMANSILADRIQHAHTNAVRAGAYTRAARVAKGCGMVVTAAISGFNEYQASSSEGSSGTATTVRVVGSVGTDLGLGAAASALGPAGLVLAVTDGLTGQNYSNTVKQIVRVPTVLMSDNRTQQAYVQNVKSGEYSCAVKVTYEAGEVWAERGFLGTLNALGVAYGLLSP